MPSAGGRYGYGTEMRRGMETERMPKTRAAGVPFGSVLCVVLASVCFSTGGLFVKLIPWSPLAINGFRNLIGAFVTGAYLLVTKHRLTFSREVLIGAFSMMGVTTLFTVANKLTTAANTVVLQFTAPVFVILLMALRYRVRPKRVELVTCAAVLLGILVVFADGIRAGGLPGDLAALASGFCYAGVFMMNMGEKADAYSSTLIGQLAAAVLFTPLCFRETDFSPVAMTSALALGLVQVGAAYVLFSTGIRRTPPVTASLISGLEPVLSPLWVALFYGERVTPVAVAGAVIVVGSVIAYNLWMARAARGSAGGPDARS